MSGAGVIDYDGATFCQHTQTEAMGGQRLKWPSGHLLYFVESSLPGLPIDTFVACVDTAFAGWSTVANVSGRRTLDRTKAQLILTLQTERPGSVLADCEMPTMGDMRQQCHCRVDTAEGAAWCISDNPPSNRIDLTRVLMHEFGHLLGMWHSTGGNLMDATYSSRIRLPQRDDIATIVGLYGLPVAEPVPATPPVFTDEAFAELAKWLEQGARIVAKIGRRP